METEKLKNTEYNWKIEDLTQQKVHIRDNPRLMSQNMREGRPEKGLELEF